MAELLIRGARVIDPFQNLDGVLDVAISRGRVSEVGRGLSTESREVLEAEGLVLAPGFLDMHVHLRDPGREDEETLESGLKAAVRGGFTAVCCMPNTDPPLDNAALVEDLVLRSRGLGLADLFPVGCLTRGREGKELAEMGLMYASAARVRAFSDDGDAVADSGLMRRALQYVRKFGGVVISHPEDVDLSRGGQVNEGRVSFTLGLRGIPALAEEVMVARDILLAEETGARLHLTHLSTAGSVRLLREAKERGVRVTADATPHHLVLSERDIRDYDTVYKVNPPLRTPEDVSELRRALADGTLDAVATDHAPHSPEEKEREFDYAPFGMVGMESAFPVLYTELVEKGELELPVLIERLTLGPARAVGLEPPDYGEGIRAGARADLVLLDTAREWVIDAHAFASRGRNCPFHGWRVRGRVLMTIKGGKVVHYATEWGRAHPRGEKVSEKA
ncbi:dihydroorotase [Candidatus Solincola tengchongensis]|uniref:dihydroorotase n=1 Tax=Candidatus Solincola tengchongensis TaxID=2900693 RepID=UPI00257F3F79|nr:dihydroorotase [Candidatus Solincola tengchongensis]